MKFELGPHYRNVPDDNLIKDVKDVSKRIGGNTVTIAEYERFVRYHLSTLQRRFRSWFNVLENAGLQENCARKLTKEMLLINRVINK